MRMATPVLIAVLLAALPASAQDAVSHYEALGTLERATVDDALAERELTLATTAEGRTVCEVHTRRFRIIQEPDKLPMWLNTLHRVSRADAVSRAVTLEPGDAYSELGRSDSERQLRNPTLFSVAVVLPVEGEGDCVDLLVVTRDAWSLTANVAPEFNGGVMSTLYVGITEANLFGTTHSASVSMNRTPFDVDFGPSFSARRLGDTRWSLGVGGRLYFDTRGDDGLDGTSSFIDLRRPLFSSDTRWGGGFSVAHANTVQRVPLGAQLRRYQATFFDDQGEVTDTELVRERWRQRSVAAEASVTRSFGLHWKNELTGGLFYRNASTGLIPEPGVSDEAIAQFEADVLPVDRRRVGPSLRWAFFQNRHMRLRNYRTYAVAEEIRVGPSTSAGVSLEAPGLGSDDRVLNTSVGVGWLAPLNDGLFATSVATSSRYTGAWSDIGISGAARWVSAPWFWGRLVLRVSGGATYDNQLNSRVLLGGRQSLRGYVEGFDVGDRWLRTNAEWRSNPIRLFLWRFGFAAFHDGAAAWAEDEPVEYYQSVGVGLRVFIPQLGTQIRAIDLSFPLRDALGTTAGRPVFSYGVEQSF